MTKKQKQQQKHQIVLITAVIIGSSIIGITGRLFEKEAEASLGNVSANKLSKIEEIKQIEVVDLISNNPSKEIEIRQAVEKACQDKKLGEQCEKDLLAIALYETRGKLTCERDGDGGKSFGCWQIHSGYHAEVTKEKALDSEYSAKWVLNRMIAYGYPEAREYAIRKHNGSATNPVTLTYLQGVNSYAQ